MSKYLTFIVDEDASEGKKTKVFDVVSTSGNYLGKVKWYSAWRQYVYYPWPDTLYNETCMREIAYFCRTQTAERKLERELTK